MTVPTAPVDFAAVLVMAGSGSRLGADEPKAYVLLAGKPLWRHSAETLARTPGLHTLVLVAPADRVVPTAAEARTLGVPVRVIAGGARRQDSVRLGVEAAPPSVAVLSIHDAARPLLSAETAEAVVREAARTGAAIAAVPVRDTLKRVRDDGVIDATVPRDGLWHAQTPQAFRSSLLRRAHDEAARRGLDVTDDAQLVESLGLAEVHVVRGDPWNFKVTEPSDRDAATALLAARAAGGGR